MYNAFCNNNLLTSTTYVLGNTFDKIQIIYNRHKAQNTK